MFLMASWASKPWQSSTGLNLEKGGIQDVEEEMKHPIGLETEDKD